MEEPYKKDLHYPDNHDGVITHLEKDILECEVMWALEIATKREVKSKGEQDGYTHLNAEFQRPARRDKKAFFSNQCKEIEENYRMGKTRNLFKKIRDTKGTFHAEMGTIKNRNGRDLTEAEDIKKRWQEYTELYKKISI